MHDIPSDVMEALETTVKQIVHDLILESSNLSSAQHVADSPLEIVDDVVVRRLPCELIVKSAYPIPDYSPGKLTN